MSIALVCIGNEILDGDTLNTNLQALARSLKQWGYAISEEVCICDTPQAIEEQLTRLLRTAKLIFTIGGLGPTRDDLTRETIARLLNKKLVLDQDLMEKISSRFRHRNSPDFEQARRKQATIIEGAKVLFNHWGIAPGLWCLLPDDKVICMLPGPPRECVPMIQHYLPELLKTLMPPQRACMTLPVFGIGESSVAAQTDPVLADYPHVQSGYCVGPARVDVRLETRQLDKIGTFREIHDRLKNIFGARLGEEGDDIVSMIFRRLREYNYTLACAESCTGGWIAKTITDTPGVSDCFLGSLVVYSNRLKHELLGVDQELIRQFGAVSEPVARAMVEGLCRRYQADAGIAVTGIAGPGGGSPEKPCGTVHIATMLKDRTVHSHHVLPFDRNGVRERTVHLAFAQLLAMLLE